MKTNSKNVRIELLRFVSMLMILMLHYFNQGKVLSLTSEGSMSFYLVWTIEGICFISVNIYMFISGYFLSCKTYTWKRLISFYATILVYTVLLSIVCTIVGWAQWDVKTILSVFPIIGSRKNWYVTIYFAIIIISPLLNCIVKNMEKIVYKRMLILLFFLFSMFPTVFFWVDQFDLNDGYSILWYGYLYLVAAYIRKYGVNIKNRTLIIMFSGIIIVPISRFVIIKLSSSYAILKGATNILYSYNSFPVFLASLALFIIVINKGVREKNNWVDTIILILGETSFGVFFIHSFVLIRDNLWVYLGSKNYIDTPYQVLHGIGCIVLVYIVCSIIDLGRKYAFKYLGVDSLVRKIYQKLDNCFCL